MSLAEKIQNEFDAVAAEYVKRLRMRVTEAGDDDVVMTLPVTPELVHGGGVLCGQAILAAADTAMVCAMSAALGGFRPMTTVQLQTSFLRPVPADAGTVTVTARILRRGKNLSFGDVHFAVGDKLVAQATSTYALL
jgi:uncharacterized protein (TIGR00369 family)